MRRPAVFLLCAMVFAPFADAPGALAAGGRRIAYLRYTDPYWQVWVMDAGRGRQRQVTRSAGDKLRVSWFPDGRRLMFNLTIGQIWTVDLLSGREERVPVDLEGITDARVSPDGRWIAFSTSTGGGVDNNDIWLVRPDGTELQRMTDMAGLQHSPAWAPDGRHLVFLSGEGKNNHDIYRLEIATHTVTPLTSGQLYNFDVAVSAPGKIAFSSNRSGDYDIWVMDWEGTGARPVAPSPGLDAQPDWRPDGSWLVFTSNRDAEMGLWKVREDGSRLRRLVPKGQRCKGGVWSP